MFLEELEKLTVLQVSLFLDHSQSQEMWQLSRNMDLIWHPLHQDIGQGKQKPKPQQVLSKGLFPSISRITSSIFCMPRIWGCASPQQPGPLDSQVAQCGSYHITDSSHFLTWRFLILTLGLLKSILLQAQYLLKQKHICTFQLAQDCRLTGVYSGLIINAYLLHIIFHSTMYHPILFSHSQVPLLVLPPR